MSSKKRLVIHVGLPRTGTTSMQSFLRRNEAALNKRGFCYPRIDADRYLLSSADGGGIMPKATLQVFRKGGNHAILGFAAADPSKSRKYAQFQVEKRVWTDLLANFRDSDYHTAIISYESFGGTPENFTLTEFREQMSDFHVTGLIYLRRFDGWIKSLFDQAVRGPSRFAGDFKDFVYYRNAESHLFMRKIDRIRERFFLDDLIARNFDKAAKSNGLLEDLLSSVGLLDDEMRQIIARHRPRNASLSPSQTLVLQTLNRWRISDDDFVAVRSAFLQSSFDEGPRDPHTLVSAADLEHLRNVAATDAIVVKQCYGIDVLEAAEPTRRPSLPNRLSKARFDEVVDFISDKIRPDLVRELRNRSVELDDATVA